MSAEETENGIRLGSEEVKGRGGHKAELQSSKVESFYEHFKSTYISLYYVVHVCLYVKYKPAKHYMGRRELTLCLVNAEDVTRFIAAKLYYRPTEETTRGG